ncbi:MAG: HIRAN domain-containing protein [Bacteroidetes bacterium]|nr:HIRAN domain-containing protein [Bacteroidota bacterium]
MINIGNGKLNYLAARATSSRQRGGMLELVREPGNKHDEFAVALHFNSKKIGFVPAESNEMLARLIDIGTPQMMVEITHLKTEAAYWEQVAIAIYVLKEKIESSKSIRSIMLNTFRNTSLPQHQTF